MTSLQDKIQSKLQTNNKKMLQEIDEIIATFKSFIMKSVHDIVIIIGKISARLTTHNSPSIGCSSGTNISKKVHMSRSSIKDISHMINTFIQDTIT